LLLIIYFHALWLSSCRWRQVQAHLVFSSITPALYGLKGATQSTFAPVIPHQQGDDLDVGCLGKHVERLETAEDVAVFE